MIDLKKTTFISALKIESEDRLNNTKSVLGYLNHNFKTNVFLYEVSDGESKIPFAKDFKNLNIKILLDNKSQVFHRTKFLNTLLKYVKTEVVCNYDIDVILPKKSYLDAENIIVNNEADVVYPFFEGKAQVCIPTSFNRGEFEKDFSLEKIHDSLDLEMNGSLYGHCVFFNTKEYKKIGGENEHFISYGPEDYERVIRALKLGLRISRFGNKFVYHFEHSRGKDSGKDNPFYELNCEEIKKIEDMSKEEIIKYIPEL